MREVSRRVVAAHQMLRPIAAARQVTPERLHAMSVQAIEADNTAEWLKLRAVDAVRPLATRNYDLALRAASVLTGKRIIGAGLEAIVAHDGGHLVQRPVSKFATHVNGDPRQWSDRLARRLETAQGVMGKFIVDTEYSAACLRGSTDPSLVIMNQPLLDIWGDGHTDSRVADQRGEFRDLSEKLARDHGLYFDVIPGHGNLVVHKTDNEFELAVCDTVIMSVEDNVRPFVNFAPNPIEWTTWLQTVHA